MADYKFGADRDVIFFRPDATFVSDDPDRPSRIAFEAWLAAGNVPDPFIPRTVTPRQARLALLAAGLLPAVEAAVAQAGGATQINWEYATEINRSDDLISAIGGGLGLSEEQLDALFLAASAL